MKKISFFLMNDKGYYVLEKFIDKFGASQIAYIVSYKDQKIIDNSFINIKTLAKKNKINFYVRKKLPFKLENKSDILKIAIGWKWIINNTKNLIILHDSLLPKYRGFAPLVNSLINFEKSAGVTAIKASQNYDQGKIIFKEKIKITYPLKIIELIEKIKPLYFKILSKIYLKRNVLNAFNTIKQVEGKASYSIWLNDKDYFIDWNWTAKKIKRFVDAVGYPYDGSKSVLNHKKIVKINQVKVIKDVKVISRERHIGKIIFFKNKFPVVICGKGLLEIIDLRDDSNKLYTPNLRSKFC